MDRRVWALLALLGCDDGGERGATDGGVADGGAADAGTDAMTPGLCVGSYVIAQAEVADPGCLDEPLVVGGRLVVSGERLQVGGLDLAIVEADARCGVRAVGCAIDPVTGQRVAHDVEFDGTRLTLTTERVAGFRPVVCRPLTFVLEPAGACGWDGVFDVEAPTLADGMCDLAWSAEVVTIDTVSDSPALLWGDRSHAITAVDAATCTVTAELGLALFNGVPRETTITAQVDRDQLELTINDRLEGTSDFGDVCVGGRFEASGRAIPPGGVALEASCEALPFVCGDGMCDAAGGEHCENCLEDCACGDGSCVRIQPPGAAELAVCTTSCEAVACGEGERCVPASEYSALFVSGEVSRRICLSALGDVGVGGDCEDSRLCGPGLVCARNIQPGGRCLAPCDTVDRATCSECWPIDPHIEVCRPRCSANVTDGCGASVCSSQTLNGVCSSGDGASWFCHPQQLVYECRPDGPAFGEPCAERDYCAAGLACFKDDCTRNDRMFDCQEAVCSRTCETDADCEAPLGRCSVLDGPQGTSRWCRAL